MFWLKHLLQTFNGQVSENNWASMKLVKTAKWQADFSYIAEEVLLFLLLLSYLLLGAVNVLGLLKMALNNIAALQGKRS